jgi:hypothetical protein
VTAGTAIAEPCPEPDKQPRHDEHGPQRRYGYFGQIGTDRGQKDRGNHDAGDQRQAEINLIPSSAEQSPQNSTYSQDPAVDQNEQRCGGTDEQPASQACKRCKIIQWPTSRSIAAA